MEERNNINKFRKKRALQKLIFRLSVLLLIVLATVLIVVNWGKIIAPLKDAALDVGKGGFPVQLPGSAGYALDDLGENFYLLTDTYIYTYNEDGALITDIQHGFQNPYSASNDKRIVVYDKNGKSFNFYSRKDELYTITLDDSIVFADIGNDDRCAVVTTSARYSNYLYVFNNDGKQIFRWASPNLKIMQVEFSDDDKSIYVAALGSDDGDLQLYLIRFDLDNAESHLWQTYIGADISYSVEFCDDGVFVVTGGGCSLVDDESGEVIVTSDFSKSISKLPERDELRTVLFRDPATNGDVLTVYGEGLDASATLFLEDTTKICEQGGNYYILTGSVIKSFNSRLEPLKTYQLDDVYSDMIVIGEYAYLLGYNVVQRLHF